MNVMSKTLRAALRAVDLDKCLNIILEQTMNRISAEGGIICLIRGKNLVPRCDRNISSQFRMDFMGFVDGKPMAFLRKTRILHGNSKSDDPMWGFCRKNGIQLWIGIPLIVSHLEECGGAKWLGTICLFNKSTGYLEKGVIRSLLKSGPLLALAVHHSEVHRTAMERLVRLQSLHEIDRAIIQHRQLKDILRVVLERVPRRLGADAAAISLFSDETGSPFVFIMRLPNGSFVEERAFELADSLLHWFIERKELVVIHDLYQDPRLQMHRHQILKHGLGSYLGVPLVVRGKAIGILHILSRNHRIFADEDMDFFKTMAGQVAIAIANARIHETLVHRSSELERLVETLKRSQEEARRIQDNLNTAQRIAHLGSWEWDAVRDELSWSAEVYRIFGTTPEAFDGTCRFFLECVHPGDRDAVKKSVDSALFKGADYNIEHRIIRPDGSERIVQERAEVARDDRGKPVRMIGTVQDVTDIRHAQKALQDSEEQFRNLVENSPFGIIIVQHWMVVYQNPELRRLLGAVPERYPVGNLIHQVHAEDQEKAARSFGLFSTCGDLPQDVELRIFPVDKIGDETHMKWVHCRPISIKFKEEAALLLNMVDITRSKELEQFAIVREKMAALGHISAGIAHEIRSPLSAINIFLDAIAENLDRPESRQDLNDAIAEAKSAAGVIESVITRVLDFSRPGESRLQYGHIHNPIEEAIRMMGPRLRKSKIELEVELAYDLPKVYFDSKRIMQVLINLITNAMEAIEKDSEKGKILISTNKEGAKVCIKVSDSGPGVESGEAERIFEPFYTTKKGSPGIGLSICQRILLDHGGLIKVSDSKLGGSEFSLMLPIEKRLTNRR